MRLVSIKNESSQVISVIQRIRSSYLKDRTACMSRIGSILLEFGMSFPKSHAKMKALFQWIADNGEPIPPMLLLELRDHHDYYLKLNQHILTQDTKLKEIVDHDERAQLLMTIPGVGNLTASRCLSDISNAADFKNGRQLTAWIGLVPRQFSTGGKPRLFGIIKRGNKGLRELLIHRARAVLVRPEKAVAIFGNWILELLSRKPFNVVVVALANKLARIAWSVLSTKQAFEVRVQT